jgi:hypothetical protein
MIETRHFYNNENSIPEKTFASLSKAHLRAADKILSKESTKKI